MAATTCTRTPAELGSTIVQQAPALLAQLGLLVLLALTTGLGVAGWAVGVGYLVGLLVLLTQGAWRIRVYRLGPADQVTLARAALIGGVTALVADHLDGKPPLAFLVPLTAIALALDAVDGQVARRTGTASALGARFDMEADAFLILVLSVLVAASAGPWVLAIGLMRYAFVAAARAWPWLRASLRPSRARKVVAALQGVALTAAAVGVWPAALAGVALAMLSWSFGRDVWWLYRNRTVGSVY
ncbi:CDP-alcohol phosphatidyltransferase family protein [Amycolatopsis benzoatilytica]|uniref:CDP-alcohol phosphatidyltransferase family protein n=1 Tax=Amycolatopsis benzoatilytica TaxID=346045 RepID=UPI0003663506|nr:CDP-alcohol phosphatidyltransferase family protein [Amycolatopsis benzoatilytica]